MGRSRGGGKREGGGGGKKRNPFYFTYLTAIPLLLIFALACSFVPFPCLQTIHLINHYPVNSTVCFLNIYSLKSDQFSE